MSHKLNINLYAKIASSLKKQTWTNLVDIPLTKRDTLFSTASTNYVLHSGDICPCILWTDALNDQEGIVHNGGLRQGSVQFGPPDRRLGGS